MVHSSRLVLLPSILRPFLSLSRFGFNPSTMSGIQTTDSRRKDPFWNPVEDLKLLNCKKSKPKYRTCFATTKSGNPCAKSSGLGDGEIQKFVDNIEICSPFAILGTAKPKADIKKALENGLCSAHKGKGVEKVFQEWMKIIQESHRRCIESMTDSPLHSLIRTPSAPGRLAAGRLLAPKVHIIKYTPDSAADALPSPHTPPPEPRAMHLPETPTQDPTGTLITPPSTPPAATAVQTPSEYYYSVDQSPMRGSPQRRQQRSVGTPVRGPSTPLRGIQRSGLSGLMEDLALTDAPPSPAARGGDRTPIQRFTDIVTRGTRRIFRRSASA